MACCRSAPWRQPWPSTSISAVVIRSAPGEPIASARPSAARPVVGCHVGGEPGAGRYGVQPVPVELGLAEAVVEQDAGARDAQPGAVPAAHGDRARGALVVDRPRCAPWRPSRAAPAMPCSPMVGEQVLTVLRRGPRSSRAPTCGRSARRAGSRARPPRSSRPRRASSLSIAASIGPPTDGRRVDRDVPVADVAARCAGRSHRAVRREVLGRDQPAAVLHLGRPAPHRPRPSVNSPGPTVARSSRTSARRGCGPPRRRRAGSRRRGSRARGPRGPCANRLSAVIAR